MQKSLLLFLASFLVAQGVNAQVSTQGGKLPQLPEILGDNGGLKVECIFGCGGGAGGTVDVSDRIARELGRITFSSPQHIICDSGCGSPPATADNSAFTFGTTSVSPIGFVVDDTATNTVTENSFGAPRMSINRILYADISKSASNTNSFKVDFGGAAQPISGSVSVSNFPATQTVDTELPAAVSLFDNITLANSPTVGSMTYIHRVATGTAYRAYNAESFIGGTTITGINFTPQAFMGMFDNVSPTVPAEDTFQYLRMSSNRNLFSQIRDAAGNERGANVNASNQLSVSVDNTPNVNVTNTANVSVTNTPTVAISQTTTNNDVDANVTNFPTTASTSAVSVRCVNTAGNAFESCGGTGGSGGGDGAILDGATPTTKATVFALTNSNPLAVQLVDANGSAPISNPSFLTSGLGIAIGTATSAPIGTELGLIVRNIPSGTQTISGSVTGTDTVSGDVAHDGVDSGNPIKIGGKALTSAPAIVANGDRVNQAYDVYGVQYARNDHVNRFQCTLDAVAATLTQCQAAPGAGLSIYISDVLAGSTTTTAGQHLLRYGTGTNCGTGTTTLFPGTTATPRVSSPPTTAANNAYSFRNALKVPANNALCVLGVATNTTWIVITGFIAP